ncbi:MAG: tRNA (adenosine(37)-N6)-threonylcarbamoyltransferase complex transferase subunit TsaD [Candidatus Schekmanbacteria bacterium]|nr:tRNA (adenosine(37)-N6)-threonylcarbamoyltransferase complex transferase subunit TsaD [Candidatus Schekmanbacteria bacterium]
MLILGIESSCDDTSAAIVADGYRVLANVVSSQIKAHEKYGGVVPEIASRQHLTNILPVIDQALEQAKLTIKDIDVLAVTNGPGLMGSLLVGVCSAKAIAYAADKPLIAVNHLEGHLAALQLQEEPWLYPFIGLIVSGGHSSLYLVSGNSQYRLLGRTRDDAVGEAFDKVAKILGLGYPGGPVIDKLSEKGIPDAVKFPRSFLEKDSYDFSFSGIKTAVWHYIKKQLRGKAELDDREKADIACGFQRAVVEVLVVKTVKAALDLGIGRIAMSGGVACNRYLRQEMQRVADLSGLQLHYPKPEYCTDNAAMIAAAAYYRDRNGDRGGVFAIDAIPYCPL